MRKQIFEGGYKLWLSVNDTYGWAHKSGASWPCSTLSNNRVFVEIDRNGLVDCLINGRPDGEEGFIDGNELSAIIADFQPKEARHLWPSWETK